MSVFGVILFRKENAHQNNSQYELFLHSVISNTISKRKKKIQQFKVMDSVCRIYLSQLFFLIAVN